MEKEEGVTRRKPLPPARGLELSPTSRLRMEPRSWWMQSVRASWRETSLSMPFACWTELVFWSAAILVAAAVKLNTFVVPDLSTPQLGEILTRLATTEDWGLRRLELSYSFIRRDLTHLPLEIVADGMVKLEKVDKILRHVEIRTKFGLLCSL